MLRMSQNDYSVLTKKQASALRKSQQAKAEAEALTSEAEALTSDQSEVATPKVKRKSAPNLLAPNLPRKEEHRQQSILFSRIHDWEKLYPVLLLCYAVPNGGSGQRTDAGRLHMYQEGLRSGVPDVQVDAARLFRGAFYHGLRIEIKVNGNSASESQAKMHRMLMVEGFLVFIKFDGLQAWALIAEYLGLPKELWV